MRVLVYGTGAVGGYFGACLARGGHDVTFVARGATLDALRAHGLVVELPGDRWHLTPVRAVDTPAAAPAPELVLVCVKSYDTPAAAEALRGVVGPDTICLSLQNGVENEDILARGLGSPPLLVAFTRIGVAMPEPGRIVYSGRGEIVFGEADGTRSPRAERLAAALRAAGIAHQLRSDVLVGAWEKLAWNAGFNAVTALTGTTVAQVLAHPGSRELVIAAMEEVDAVATAAGIPVRRRRTRAVLDDSLAGLPDFETSMLQDLRRGRRLEHDALNGAVVRAASRTGVAVPVNRTLLALLDGVDPGRAR
ncbi:MAG TPA: ketopantoate reductase family protein [Candidatus Limnocylindria bacterium]|nr:ketopantoate reductase family protein [Candidatus Limnocylindria bacterium]